MTDTDTAPTSAWTLRPGLAGTWWVHREPSESDADVLGFVEPATTTPDERRSWGKPRRRGGDWRAVPGCCGIPILGRSRRDAAWTLVHHCDDGCPLARVPAQ